MFYTAGGSAARQKPPCDCRGRTSSLLTLRLLLSPLELGVVGVEVSLLGVEALSLLLEVGHATSWTHV
jgi:hypothetical protein